MVSSVAGTLRHGGASPEALAAALTAENAAKCCPPLDAAEVAKIVASATGKGGHGLRERPELLFQTRKGLAAVVPRVDVEDEKVGLAAGVSQYPAGQPIGDGVDSAEMLMQLALDRHFNGGKHLMATPMFALGVSDHHASI
jgi:hypothetical protein